MGTPLICVATQWQYMFKIEIDKTILLPYLYRIRFAAYVFLAESQELERLTVVPIASFGRFLDPTAPSRRTYSAAGLRELVIMSYMLNEIQTLHPGVGRWTPQLGCALLYS